jgi:S-DNA-T family DNA segregation ATPase FtsK/SpoIIIE
VASLKARTSRAAGLHRQAAAVVAAATAALDTIPPTPVDEREQHDLAERLRAAAALLAPGWLGAALDTHPPHSPPGGAHLPGFVRLGTARPVDDAEFPVVVPLLGTGHLAVDADAGDPRVAGLLRAVLLRLLAASPPGSLLVRGVDATSAGRVFAPFAPLADAGLMAPPVTDRAGLRAVLTEAEQWVRPASRATARPHRRDRTLLLVITALPRSADPTDPADGSDLARITALAQHGPESGLHLIVAGWPPPAPATGPGHPAAAAGPGDPPAATGAVDPLPAAESTRVTPLPRSTTIRLGGPYALVGDPPGASFGSPTPYLPSVGLNAPVLLDPEPPARLLDRLCRELAAQVDVGVAPALTDLLPGEATDRWSGDATDGLATVVGYDAGKAVPLGFSDLTPNWLVGGRAGAGKTAFLVNTVYGLCARYAPEELALYLLDPTGRGGFAEFTPTRRDPSWLPHAHVVGVGADREYGLAVLREIDAELDSRTMAFASLGVTRFAELRQRRHLPRAVCVIDEFQVLLADGDTRAAEAAELLESVARRGRSYGIHLVLAGRSALGGAVAGGNPRYAERDGLLGQFPVRVALPGGGHVLEPSNDAAAGLPLGTAVVNTAGGLGGPRGATRGHERLVRFPDLHSDRVALAALRRRLWQGRAVDALPPRTAERGEVTT